MTWTDDYELIDFGAGRKLERFGCQRVDRPCPAAQTEAKRRPDVWAQAILRYHANPDGKEVWTGLDRRALWEFRAGPLRLTLQPTPAGQVGLFPEQLPNWEWIDRQVRRAARPEVLNLFGYTGGASLAAAAASGRVAHVDASRPVVQWARQNAELNGLDKAPIRWLVDDARKFVRRELRRGHRYHGLILDPPSYGHGRRGEAWQLTRHLPELLAECVALFDKNPAFWLLSCHTPGYDAVRLQRLVEQAGLPVRDGYLEARELVLTASSTDWRLPCGHMVRWSAADEEF